MTVAELIATLQACDPDLPVRLHVHDEVSDTWHEDEAATVCVFDGAVNLCTPGD